MEVRRVGVHCVKFLACHCCSVVVGPVTYGQAASNVETFLEIFVAREWKDETDS